uniref:Transposase n=1 Tax=Portunus trituberculatus TaxID=210409 RepID=B3CK23_PORTR|nr:transposase [Portunus trituberculatus]
MASPHRTDWRFYVFIRTKLGEGESLEDDPRTGRPSTSRTEENIAAVRRMIEENRHTTIAVISDDLGLSTGSIHTIIHEDLKMRKVCSRWVPHLLSDDEKMRRVQCASAILTEFGPDGHKRITDIVTGDEKWFYFFQVPHKRQNMVWLGEKDARPTVVKGGFRSRKQMFIVFFSSTGPVSVVTVPKGQNVSATYYTETALKSVVKNLEKTKPTRLASGKVHLHHDNALQSHAVKTRQFLEESKLQLINHPPYSPDLAPCDFWLFPKLSEKLAGINFQREQDLARKINAELRTISDCEYSECFVKWMTRLQKCVNLRGEYVEGV